MSQQINLYNPQLRKQREWLSLPVVALAAGAVILMEGALFFWQGGERADLQQQLAAAQGQARQLQEELGIAGKALAERKANTALAKDIELAADSLKQREDVLRVLDLVKPSGEAGFAGYFMAFARQTIEGVWLTGFSIAQDRMEIHGRMVDGALLPVYIRRLDAESAFRGRRFAALDMKGVVPTPEKPTAESGARKPAQPYIEFVLETGAPKVEGK